MQSRLYRSIGPISELCDPVCSEDVPSGFYGYWDREDTSRVEQFPEVSPVAGWRWVQLFYRQGRAIVAWHPTFQDKAFTGPTVDAVLNAIWHHRHGSPPPQRLPQPALAARNSWGRSWGAQPPVLDSLHDVQGKLEPEGLPTVAQVAELAMICLHGNLHAEGAFTLALQLQPALSKEAARRLYQALHASAVLRHHHTLHYQVAMAQRDASCVDSMYLFHALQEVIEKPCAFEMPLRVYPDAVALLSGPEAAYFAASLPSLAERRLERFWRGISNWTWSYDLCSVTPWMDPGDAEEVVNALLEAAVEQVGTHIEACSDTFDTHSFGRTVALLRHMAPGRLHMDLSVDQIHSLITRRAHFNGLARQLLEVLPAELCYEVATTVRHVSPDVLALLGPRLEPQCRSAAAAHIYEDLLRQTSGGRRGGFGHYPPDGVTIARTVAWDPEPLRWVEILHRLASNEQRVIAALHLALRLPSEQATECWTFAAERFRQITNDLTCARLAVAFARALMGDAVVVWDDDVLRA